MKKRGIIISSILALFVLGVAGAYPSNDQKDPSSNTYDSQTVTDPILIPAEEPETPICDGKSVVANCILDGIEYLKYVYHEAVPEKSHNETITNYRQEITGYCTICNDGTRSPSCATGRGACSHHGGVAQWNAPIYRNIPEYITNKVIDQPAQEAYYEKVLAE